MPIKFSRKLIKGRIGELIFEEMIRDEGRYTVIPFGYEYTLPTLAQYRKLTRIRHVMDSITDAPDFVLISEDRSKVHLVEVKFRRQLDSDGLKKEARRLFRRWNDSWLFIATPDGFYCSRTINVMADGRIRRLSEKWVDMERQKSYLDLLNEFRR